MKKSFFLAAGILVFCALNVGAQQITRIAVIDLNKVYTTFFRDSRAVRDFEDKAARIQAEEDRMMADIQTLEVRRVDAVSQGNATQALQLESEIYRRTEELREYHRVKLAELEDERTRLASSDSFMEQVNNEIRVVAEAEGYSLVLRSSGDMLLWYSPTVDITEKVVMSLLSKAGR
jgi:outer membrane protein